MTKSNVVEWLVSWTDGWNSAIHAAIEKRVMSEYKKLFPDSREALDERIQTIDKMRTFYYQRMMATAALLLSMTSLVVAIVAILLSLVGMIHLGH